MGRAHDFVPRREAQRVTWLQILVRNLSPDPGAFGVPEAMFADLQAKVDAAAEAYRTATSRITRTPIAVMVKDELLAGATDAARRVARLVQATPAVDDSQRFRLGLTVPQTPVRVVAPPSEPPGMWILSSVGRTVKVRLYDTEATTRRGRPVSATGAAVFYFVGDHPPADGRLWEFKRNVSRTTFTLTFPSDLAPGTKVWLSAYWFSARAERSRMSRPTSVNLPGGSLEVDHPLMA